MNRVVSDYGSSSCFVDWDTPMQRHSRNSQIINVLEEISSSEKNVSRRYTPE